MWRPGFQLTYVSKTLMLTKRLHMIRPYMWHVRKNTHSTVNCICFLLSVFGCIFLLLPFRSMFGFYSVWYFVDQGLPVVQKITFQTIQWAKRIPQSIQKSMVFPQIPYNIYGKYFLAQPQTAIVSQPLMCFTMFLPNKLKIEE